MTLHLVVVVEVILVVLVIVLLSQSRWQASILHATIVVSVSEKQCKVLYRTADNLIVATVVVVLVEVAVVGISSY